MALARTNLTAPITASQLVFGVASTANQAFPGVGAPPLGYQQLLVDDEVMFLVGCPAVNTVQVRGRGSDGQNAIAHDINATVVTSSNPSDFPANQPGMLTLMPPSRPYVLTYGQSGVITVPIENTYAFLNGSSAQVMTLGAPSLALNGCELVLTSQSAFAHTVTVPGVSGSTGLYFTGAVGSPFTVATYAAVPGSSMTLVASNGFWNVINASITPVTFT